jgi:broad specificity phosphatase PhoE
VGVIYLLRHGQAPPHAYGVGAARVASGLTELGRVQAQLTGHALAARIGSVDAAISGDLVRQEETLDIVVETLSCPVEPVRDPRWNEYDIDAVLGGGNHAVTTTGPALQHILDSALDAWVGGRTDGAGLETYPQYQNRCTAALESARELAGPGKTVLAVSSSGTIAQILSQLWGVDGRYWIRMSRTMVNASITKLIVGSTGVSVVSVNEHAQFDLAESTGARPLMTFR